VPLSRLYLFGYTHDAAAEAAEAFGPILPDDGGPGAGEGVAQVAAQAIVNRQAVLLHGFIKKGQKTPARDLAVARQRKELL
jgi:hypothetical protein